MKYPLSLKVLLIITSFTFIGTSHLSRYQDDWPVPEEYKNMENLFKDAPDSQQKGRSLFTQHCKSCHGEEGRGDGVMAENLDREIADLSQDSVQMQTDGSLYYKFVFGRAEMPSFKTKIFRDQERWLLVNYLRTLAE